MSQMNRLNFDYTTEGMKQLDDLKKKLGVGSRAEVVRYAQGILNWAVQQAEQGNQLISVNSSSGTVKELSVPPLEEIRSHALKHVQHAAMSHLVRGGEARKKKKSLAEVAGTIAASNTARLVRP